MLGVLPKAELKERPEINSSYMIPSQFGEPRSLDLDTLLGWIKRTPECMGILKRIATDIVTAITFNAVDEKKMGRPAKSLNQNREDKANLFARRNQFRSKLFTAVLDWLWSGDAYVWKGRISENQIKEIANKHYSEMGIEVKELNYKQFYDEDFNGINAIEVVPSSMTRIKHDDYKIQKYVQMSTSNPGHDREFTPDEIIHAKFMELDGKVYGYSPMEASFIAIKTVCAIQDYNYNYFANGIKPDRAWLFSGNPSQTYLDKFQETLSKYKRVSKAHGDLIVAGADRIDVKDLNVISEEMEFRQLAINTVGRIAFAFNMPADILSAILGVDVKGTAMGSDIEDAGYNRNVVQSQIYWEELLNSQLWLPEFKVMMGLERTFKQDQIRQVQYQTQASTFVDFLFKHEYPITDEYIHSMLQIPRKYLTEGKIKREVEELGKPVQLPMPKGANQEKQTNAKKSQQQTQQNNNPPIGA